MTANKASGAQAGELIRNSFTRVEANGGEFAARFYHHMFELGPDLAAHFENVNMHTQGAMVVQAMRIVIGSLDAYDEIRPTIESLGYRHENYGVKPERYGIAVDAFVMALKDMPGEDIDAETERAWRDVLGLVAATMTAGVGNVAERIRKRRVFPDLGFYEQPPLDSYTARFIASEDTNEGMPFSEIDMSDYPRSIAIEFVGEGTALGSPLQTILDVSISNDIPLNCVCGGIARCSTCRVLITKGLANCLPRNRAETRIAEAKGFPPELRLACQTRTIGAVSVRPLVRDAADISDAITAQIERVGREMRVAVMFIDIREFTRFSEANLAYDVVHALNRYFDAVGRAIDAHHGYIDKYLGDGIMALFGLDTRRAVDPCVDAVNAAREAVAGLAGVNAYLAEQLNETFRIAAGIHYGDAIVGEIGFSDRRQFTAIGDVVNIAARLENKAKARDLTVLISDTVWDQLPEEMQRDMPVADTELQLSIRGRRNPLKAYDLSSALDGH